MDSEQNHPRGYHMLAGIMESWWTSEQPFHTEMSPIVKRKADPQGPAFTLPLAITIAAAATAFASICVEPASHFCTLRCQAGLYRLNHLHSFNRSGIIGTVGKKHFKHFFPGHFGKGLRQSLRIVTETVEDPIFITTVSAELSEFPP